jgi:regulator of protease activity HflC (stomatin/prohibitin superfamily)
MNKPSNPRISYLAVSSLVTGMLFFVPIISGLVAIFTGVLAIRFISKSEGNLLGKGLAYSGVGLGAVHGCIWMLVAYAGLTYNVDQGKTAIVLRNWEVVRVEEAGFHFKIPFIESIEYFPTEEIHNLQSNTGPLLFSTKESHPVEYSVLWRVCSPERAYKKFGKYSGARIQSYLEMQVVSELRMAAAFKSNLQQLIIDYDGRRKLEEQLNNAMFAYGICTSTLNFKEGAS